MFKQITVRLLAKITSTVAAGILAFGGIAGAATIALASNDADVQEDSGEEQSNDDGSGEEGSSELTGGEDLSGDLELVVPEDGEENHGAVVSAAAQDHSFDEACGNHGKYVSAVARGIELECMAEESQDGGFETFESGTEDGDDDGEAEDGDDDEEEEEEEEEEPALESTDDAPGKGNGKAKGRK